MPAEQVEPVLRVVRRRGAHREDSDATGAQRQVDLHAQLLHVAALGAIRRAISTYKHNRCFIYVYPSYIALVAHPLWCCLGAVPGVAGPSSQLMKPGELELALAPCLLSRGDGGGSSSARPPSCSSS